MTYYGLGAIRRDSAAGLNGYIVAVKSFVEPWRCHVSGKLFRYVTDARSLAARTARLPHVEQVMVVTVREGVMQCQT